MSNGFKLDHFLSYEIDTVGQDHPVIFQGQFDREPHRNRLGSIDGFCNPVSKNGEDIRDRSAHLAWYRLSAESEGTKVVEFENQFGFQKVAIARATVALVPAHKIERGSSEPRGLDYYKLYFVLRGHEPDVRRVKVEDQFGIQEATIGRPWYFGVPVSRIVDGQRSPIENEADHLVFYRIDSQEREETREVKDPFDGYKITTQHSMFLGLPSAKKAWARS